MVCFDGIVDVRERKELGAAGIAGKRRGVFAK
jgi:hypothetical protein